jgi:tetratricopeptide (TPR) repeat protein
MRRPIRSLAIACGGAAWLACASASGPAPPPAPLPTPERFELSLDPALNAKSPAQRSAWTVYAETREKAYEELRTSRRNRAADDYLIELRARAALAQAWREARKGLGVPGDDYLDGLVAAQDAGQLEEHVLGSFLKPGWTIPAAELARIDFSAVAIRPRGEAPTYAMAKPVPGALWPEIPGEKLPDPLSLHPARVPCADSLPALRRAIRSWDAERAELDGAPAAAESPAQLLTALSRAGRDSPFAATGATWVSPKPYWILFLAGFCANDQQKYPWAEEWLESAVAMAPEIDTARMELTHTLVFLRKFDRADAILDGTLARTQDRCELARAWRRRGYIRFEQRRLDESRVAYQKSLEYDPDSDLARSELDLLRRTIEQEGGHPDWYVPPASQTKVTVCPPA